MNEAEIRSMLEEYRAGACSEEEAIQRLRALPFEDLGFAKVDHHRSLRVGFPEVIFAQGKTCAQVAEIFQRLAERNPTVMATRVSEEQASAISAIFPDCEHFPMARIVRLCRPALRWRHEGDPYIAVISAGTADLPVAEEAAITAETIGWKVDRLYDVGVAGLHRLLAHGERVMRARVIIVVAGMEGALASVVGGLVKAPVIGVPTSVGYGASFQGISALLGMLTSCANGVAVVNIDNGYGAGYIAAQIAGIVNDSSASKCEDATTLEPR